MKQIKDKITAFLEAGQPIQKRRTWFNIAFHIGMKRDRRVIKALEEMIEDKQIYKTGSGKGHCFSINHRIIPMSTYPILVVRG